MKLILFKHDFEAYCVLISNIICLCEIKLYYYTISHNNKFIELKPLNQDEAYPCVLYKILDQFCV
jgi:hypothetical protein